MREKHPEGDNMKHIRHWVCMLLVLVMALAVSVPAQATQSEAQSQIDEYYERFTEIVSQGRKMPFDMVYEIADGRSYTASQALENHR